MSLRPTKGFLKVKLMRGFIGIDKKLSKCARCIGLNKRFQTSYVPIHPLAIGNVLKLKELVRVEYVNTKPEHVNPVYPKGYKVIGSLLTKEQ